MLFEFVDVIDECQWADVAGGGFGMGFCESQRAEQLSRRSIEGKARTQDDAKRHQESGVAAGERLG